MARVLVLRARALRVHALHRDGGFDRWMRGVADQFEIFEAEITHLFDRGIEFHPGQGSTISSELFARLLEVILVEMQIAEGVNEIARPKIDNLRHHHGEERIRRDVEWDAEKQIGAALVKLATQLVVLHVKLEQNMTRWQGHSVDLCRIPCAHD